VTCELERFETTFDVRLTYKLHSCRKILVESLKESTKEPVFDAADLPPDGPASADMFEEAGADDAAGMARLLHKGFETLCVAGAEKAAKDSAYQESVVNVARSLLVVKKHDQRRYIALRKKYFGQLERVWAAAYVAAGHSNPVTDAGVTRRGFMDRVDRKIYVLSTARVRNRSELLGATTHDRHPPNNTPEVLPSQEMNSYCMRNKRTLLQVCCCYSTTMSPASHPTTMRARMLSPELLLQLLSGRKQHRVWGQHRRHLLYLPGKLRPLEVPTFPLEEASKARPSSPPLPLLPLLL